MKLYLYKSGESVPLLCIENAASYTDSSVITEDGITYEPLAEGVELSSKADCSETLRADWKKNNPTQQERIEDLEELLASLLFGGEAE